MGEKSEKAFPFDSDKDSLGNNDREYYADDFARYFRSFISSGVFMKNADNLQILANDDMTVTLRPGSAIIDGYKYDNTADIVVELDPADGVLNRIDRISVTWSKGERDIHKTVQKGTSSYEPIAQECRRNEEYKDYVLADIYIPAGAIKITQDNITDQRLNTELCGLAMPFSDIDTTMIFNQLQAFYEKVVAENADWEDEKKVAFDEWFESVKDQLSGDVAGNLQNQIGNLEDLTTTNKGSLVEAINEVNEKEVDVLDTKEEIEANTDSGKVAGALAVKEMVGEVSASLVAPDYGNPTLICSKASLGMNGIIETDCYLMVVTTGTGSYISVAINDFKRAIVIQQGACQICPVKAGDTWNVIVCSTGNTSNEIYTIPIRR